MTKRVILRDGPNDGRVLPAQAAAAAYGEVLSEAGWTYRLTGERGRLIAKAYMD
jgi:hypothetical protein